MNPAQLIPSKRRQFGLYLRFFFAGTDWLLTEVGVPNVRDCEKRVENFQISKFHVHFLLWNMRKYKKRACCCIKSVCYTLLLCLMRLKKIVQLIVCLQRGIFWDNVVLGSYRAWGEGRVIKETLMGLHWPSSYLVRYKSRDIELYFGTHRVQYCFLSLMTYNVNKQGSLNFFHVPNVGSENILSTNWQHW